MPTLNVMTWNSTGETAQGAQDLLGVINHLAGSGWIADAIVVQEANANPGGLIYQMLANLGGPYNPQPSHAPEGGTAGRGYLLLTRTTIGGQGTFARINLAADGTLQAWLNANLALPARTTANNELATMRMPAAAALTVAGAQANFLTWHAPLGPSPVLLAGTLPGGANPDAYLFLQNSATYAALAQPGAGNLGVVAGDLNVTVPGLNNPTGIPALPRILPGFLGVSSNLDHYIARTHPGQPAPTFPMHQAGHYPIPGQAHAVLYGTAVW